MTSHSLLTIGLADLDAVIGGAGSAPVRKPVEVLPHSGVTFDETRKEQACIAKTSVLGTKLTDRQIGLKCGLDPQRATAYSNAVSNAEDRVNP
jgi:hypothetical protein